MAMSRRLLVTVIVSAPIVVIGLLTSTAADELSEQRMKRIERLAESDPEAAMRRAEDYLYRVRDRIGDKDWEARTARSYVQRFEDIASEQRIAAERARGRALAYMEQTEATRSFTSAETTRASLERLAEEAFRSAKEDLARSSENERRARSRLEEQLAAEEEARRLRSLASRLETLVEDLAETGAREGESQAEPKQASDPRPEYTIDLEDAVGTWRSVENPDYSIRISRNFPYVQSLQNRVEARTTAPSGEARTWRGAYAEFARESNLPPPPRITLHYVPSIDDLDRDLPPEARNAVADTVQWRMDLDESETGDTDSPRLVMRFYSGIVRYPEDRPEEARFEAGGEPTTFTLEKVSGGVLPPEGRMAATGMLDDWMKGRDQVREEGDEYPLYECSCENVQLGRIESLTYNENTDAYTKRRHFEFTTDSDIVLPTQSYMDQMCFYFTYPKEYAYMTREGRFHPCKVTVNIRVPTDRNEEGLQTYGWELFAIRGFDIFKSATTNYMCLVQADRYSRNFTQHRGLVRTRVSSREGSQRCDPVAFQVR